MKIERIVNIFHCIYSFYSLYIERMWLLYTWQIKCQIKSAYISVLQTYPLSEPLVIGLGAVGT